MRYILDKLDCAHCAAKIEREINKIEGIEPVSINFATRSIHLDPIHLEAAQEIITGIEPQVVLIPARQAREVAASGEKGLRGMRLHFIRTLLAGILFAGGLLFPQALSAVPHRLGEYGVFLTAYLLAGGPVIWAALQNLGQREVFDEKFLMTIATAGAIAIDQLPEAVAVMLFFALGEYLQSLALNRSRRSIAELLDLRPDYARLIGGGVSRRVDPQEVAVGQLIEVRPGEKIPLDGEVVSGTSFVDTSALTGESVPRRVEPGEGALAGYINGSGLLRVRVSREYAQSSVAKILALVENAAARKAPTEKFLTAFARWYTPLVVFIALALTVFPPLLLPGAVFSQWLYRGLILLVISCPCALVVSIPLGYFGGLGSASRSGILVKGANYLDALTHLHTVVLDKTGTLTKGVFRVNKIVAQEGFTEEEVLHWAALSEAHSSHPIARSILAAYGRDPDTNLIADYQEIRGRGLAVTTREGSKILVGNKGLLERAGVEYSLPDIAGTVVYVALDKVFAGYLTIADEMREESREAVEGLRRQGVKEILMVTGDNEEAAARIATGLGLDGYYPERLPEEKVQLLEELLAQRGPGEKLAFVGDGINDAPVITRADIGVAMGGLGADAAIEAADVVLMDDNPHKLVQAVDIARHTRRIVKQNIVLALGVKGLVVALGAAGLATMWLAVFADVGVALLAVLNAARTLRYGP
ncbi:MAG: cadmium-translocating P-type ATPase [Firmicutes bacterium]|nr:cadmium-translocating P-type ATPase [Bacillota bacterium]